MKQLAVTKEEGVTITMSDYCITQLKTILLLKHLNGLNAVWEDQIIFERILELENEYEKNQEYQKLAAEQQQLFQQLLESDDREQRNNTLIEYDGVNGNELIAAKQFYYLAGINDAMRIFNV
jgi:hypothetical protein